jgi:hypothetical protein
MSHFLSRLVARSLGTMPRLEPLIAPRFAPDLSLAEADDPSRTSPPIPQRLADPAASGTNGARAAHNAAAALSHSPPAASVAALVPSPSREPRLYEPELSAPPRVKPQAPAIAAGDKSAQAAAEAPAQHMAPASEARTRGTLEATQHDRSRAAHPEPGRSLARGPASRSVESGALNQSVAVEAEPAALPRRGRADRAEATDGPPDRRSLPPRSAAGQPLHAAESSRPPRARDSHPAQSSPADLRDPLSHDAGTQPTPTRPPRIEAQRQHGGRAQAIDARSADGAAGLDRQGHPHRSPQRDPLSDPASDGPNDPRRITAHDSWRAPAEDPERTGWAAPHLTEAGESQRSERQAPPARTPESHPQHAPAAASAPRNRRHADPTESAEPASGSEGVHIHIGQVLVRAQNSAPERAAIPTRPQPRLSLSDYLKQQRGGGE